MANQMISAFTPSLMSAQELETILVQRQDLAQELLEKILLSATTPAKHYALLIGMRGMGKTHLVALIYYRLLAEFAKTPTLQDQLVIAWLREEEWGVDSWLDLVSRILRALAVEEPQSKLLLGELRRISIEDSIDRAAANATRLLKEAIGDRTLLLIMENLDDLFKGLGEAGQQQFRSFLQAEQCCTILATTPALFTAVQSRTKPFFGFFNPIHLDRLTVPEAIEMLGKIATLGGQEDLASFLQTPLGRARVRAVHHLAGGNPRVYMLFSQFITRDALDNLVEAFMKMLDDLTPYYQARMKELSNQQRKIVELLVDRRHPVMVKEIAADCFIDAGTAASQLRELRKLGYVEAEQNGRESFYELREVLMRLCLEVKKQRGQWVEIFVEFLKIWYPLSERKNQLELMRGTSQYIKDEHLERALLSDEDPCFVGSQRDLQRALKEQQQLLATETLEELFDSKRLTEENYQELVELVQTDRYSEAQKLLSESVIQKASSDSLTELAFSLQFLEGLELVEAGKILEALRLFNVAWFEDRSNVNNCIGRGLCLDYLGRYEEAIASYDWAVAVKPDDYRSWNNLGFSLYNFERYEEAISSYDRAILINHDYHQAWFNKGISLAKLRRYEEAIASYDRAISINPDYHQAWFNRGIALRDSGEYKEEIASYDRAILINHDYHQAWFNKGISLAKLRRYEEAIASYDRAISINPDYHQDWFYRGISLAKLRRYEEAITSHDQAISIKPDDHKIWNNRGVSLDNLPTMGTIFEELIRKFNEALNENPGEHFTPRDVVHLMVDLMLAGDADRIRRKGIVCTVYDPCCGSGGMLMITKEHVTVGLRKNGDLLRHAINPGAEIHLFGQEVNPETWAVSKSDLFMKDPTGRDADKIAYGSTLSNDRHARRGFDYLIANPPYGKDWKRDEDAVRAEHERGASGRFAPGLPRISDGQLLFLLHMLAHAKEPREGGSRIAIIMNGSPLFTGDAGSGESEIRRFILEHDLLEALIALPEQLFYNTGIATYIWVLTNRKAPARKGLVQLIDASSSSFWVPMRKSLGDKRREIPPERAQDIVKLLADFRDGETRTTTKDGKNEKVVVSRIFPTTHFGFRKVTVERPLRLNFRASPERIAQLDEEAAFRNLAVSKRRSAMREIEEEAGREQQVAIRALVHGLPATLFKERGEFERILDDAARKAGLKLPTPSRKAILSALSERDETAAICRDKDGNPEPDPELRDTESIPLIVADDPADADGVPVSVRAFFDREVRPHVPDAWIDIGKRDLKDGRVGLIGYEINFNRYFYRYTPPRPIEEIEGDIRAIEGDIVRMLAEVTGGKAG